MPEIGDHFFDFSIFSNNKGNWNSRLREAVAVNNPPSSVLTTTKRIKVTFFIHCSFNFFFKVILLIFFLYQTLNKRTNTELLLFTILLFIISCSISRLREAVAAYNPPSSVLTTPKRIKVNLLISSIN